jgi:RNA polymerase sigma-70 factor (ECF subfamily)
LNKKELHIESELIVGLRKSDHSSFQLLFDRYSEPLFMFALSYLKSRDTAEDLVQEVFLKIWNNRKSLRTDTCFRSYLFTIALNSIYKHLKKLAKLNEFKHDLLVDFSDSEIDLNDHSDYQALIDKLNELVSRMPERRRQVFTKKKFEGKSLKEIAEELDITPKTVEYHITEAMKFLKQEFEKFRIEGMVFFYLFIQGE